jgi:DNA-binding NarL/FixJ family response regulator
MREDCAMAATVLIVDDHASFRAMARRLLEAEGYEVVGEAADGGSCLSAAALLRPDVVLLDIQLPDIDGFAVAGELAHGDSPPSVVFVSSRDESAYRRRLAGGGGRGFIAKGDLSGARLTALLE